VKVTDFRIFYNTVIDVEVVECNFPIFYNPVKNQELKNHHVPRPARKRSLRRPRLRRGDVGFADMPGACRNGIVKNQQRLDSELFQTSKQ
jgi:hypothetical protein